MIVGSGLMTGLLRIFAGSIFMAVKLAVEYPFARVISLAISGRSKKLRNL